MRPFLKLAGLALVIAVVAGSAQAASMRWAGANDILTIDPHAQNHQTTHAFLQQIYESLVRYDGKYQTEIVQKVFSNYADPHVKDCKMK